MGARLDGAREPAATVGVEAIGPSGEMRGAALLSARDRPVRPAILWSDRRALAECATLLEPVPDIGRRASGPPDPGLAVPKRTRLAAHGPETLARAVPPEDVLRLWLIGDRAAEPPDGGGTTHLDVASGRWNPERRGRPGRGEAAPDACARRGRRAAPRPRRAPADAPGAGNNTASALNAGATRRERRDP